VTKTYEIYPGPTADFTVNPLSAYVQNDITFTDISTSTFPIVDWFWDFGDGDTDTTDMVAVHQYQDGANYDVMMIITDENGCIDTAFKEVIIFMPPLVPSGFSPNGDGNNDFLFVYGGPYKELLFTVYNNWGEKLFETTDLNIGWDGRFKGAEQPLGVYVWTVRVVTYDDQEITDKGDVTLIR
jgi:gliding motility-associated-like protein